MPLRWDGLRGMPALEGMDDGTNEKCAHVLPGLGVDSMEGIDGWSAEPQMVTTRREVPISGANGVGTPRGKSRSPPRPNPSPHRPVRPASH